MSTIVEALTEQGHLWTDADAETERLSGKTLEFSPADYIALPNHDLRLRPIFFSNWALSPFFGFLFVWA